MEWSSTHPNEQDGAVEFLQDDPSLSNQSISPSHGASPAGGVGFENSDPFLSPLTNVSLDQFVQDPVYLQSQEALRSLLFSAAQSTAPTRAPSPIQDNRTPTASYHGVLSNSKRIEYLKNYVAEVAPWV